MTIIGNEDHKQRVNLSSLARSVIEMDLSVFNEGGSLSGFLNRIITAYREQAQASIELRMQSRRQQLLSQGYDPAITEKLTADYRRELSEQMDQYPKGDSIMFRLNNYNFDLLYEQQAESAAYSAPSKYLKALLEEYARLSPSEREQVYYNELIQTVIQPALDAGWQLQLTMGSKSYFIRPYALMADPFNSHMYLVGLARKADKNEENIASFRITRMDQLKLKRQSGKLTADQRQQIEKQLQQVGVQYLVGSPDHIRVRLSKLGKQAFLQRSYMRPTPVKTEGDIYHFECSPMQIRNYFLSFGKEAEILEPLSLRKDFAKIFKEASSLYKTSL